MPDSTLLGGAFGGQAGRVAGAVLAVVPGMAALSAGAQTPESVPEEVLALAGPGTDRRAAVTEGAATVWRDFVSDPSARRMVLRGCAGTIPEYSAEVPMDTAGEKEPVRVTTTDGFDGLPVPTPDGTGLSWTSTRHGEGSGGQIYLADWNNDEALAALRSAPARIPAAR